MKTPIVVIAAALVLLAAVLPGSVPRVLAEETRYDGTSSAEQQKALDYVNGLRRHMGLSEAVLDPALTAAAVNHARYADAHYTIQSEGNLSLEEAGHERYTGPTPAGRAAAAGFQPADRDIVETVYMKARAYDQFDMAAEMRELSFVHQRRAVMLSPAVTTMGIARVGTATVIVGAAGRESDEPAAVSAYPYEGMTEFWPGLFEPVDPAERIQRQGEGTTLSIYGNRRDVSDMQAELTTTAGSRRIAIPLDIRKMDSGEGYVLTAQRQLRGGREYTAEVSFRSGGETLSKRWTFRTSEFQYPLNIDDMPLMYAPPLYMNDHGRFEAPMRYLFELFGAAVDWNKTSQTITAVRNDLSLRMTIGSPVAYVNGMAVPLDSPPRLNIYTTYVPLRFVAETFGFEVDYDAASGTIDIWTGLIDLSMTDAAVPEE